MGRARKPIALQAGDLRKAVVAERENEEAAVHLGSRDLKKTPKALRDSVARKEYRRIVRVMTEIDILGDADVANVVGYANAWSKYVEAVAADDDNKIIRYGDEIRKFGRLCGLTIDSRLKFAATKTAKKEEEIETKFGVI